MSRIALSLAVCCLGLRAIAAQPASRPAAAPSDSQLVALFRAMGDAIVRVDTVALARLWAPSFVFTITLRDTTVSRTRAEQMRAIANLRRDATGEGVDSVRVARCAFRTYGDFAAGPCRVTEYQHQGNERGAAHGVGTVLFTRESGNWQILAVHTVPIPDGR